MNSIIQLFIFLIFTFSAFSVKAQQSVFNVPSADVLDTGKVYVELDVSFKTNNDEVLSKFSSIVPRVIVGAGRNVEVGLNLTGNIQPGADTTMLVPTVKWRFYQNEKKDLAFFAGNHFYIPVRNKSYKFGTYTYAAVAKTINKIHLTAGGFAASRNVFAPNAARGGGQFAIEQTINSKFTIAADWLTGKHTNGYFTPGVIYKPRPQVTTYWTYSIGNANASKGNHFFLFELGYNF